MELRKHLQHGLADKPGDVGREPVSVVFAAAEKETFDAVMVCNGHFSEPHLPWVPGSDAFPGSQLHSHSYRRPERFAGQTVAVVGASFSALDICGHVAGAAARVYLCARQWSGRKDLGGGRGARGNVERRGMITQLGADGES